MLRLSKAVKFSREHAAELEELLAASSGVSTALNGRLWLASTVSHVLACGWALCARAGPADATTWAVVYAGGGGDDDDGGGGGAPSVAVALASPCLTCVYWAITR